MSAAPAGGDATPNKIRRAAERLFAEEGFDRVTLRQIARASDQKNVNAVQYHFGSKQGLLDAIVDHHRGEIDRHRKTLLDRVAAESANDDIGAEDHAVPLGDLIRIVVEPLASKLDDPSGRAYLRIQAQGLSNDQMRPATKLLLRRISRALAQLDRVGGRTDSSKGDSSEKAASHRRRFALLLLFHALSDRAAQEERGAVPRSNRETFVDSLSQSIEGIFTQ